MFLLTFWNPKKYPEMLTAVRWKECSQPQSVLPGKITNLGIDLCGKGKEDQSLEGVYFFIIYVGILNCHLTCHIFPNRWILQTVLLEVV